MNRHTGLQEVCSGQAQALFTQRQENGHDASKGCLFKKINNIPYRKST